MPIDVPKDTWPGEVRSVTLGASADQGGSRVRAVTVGGEKTLPFMHFEAEMPNAPVIAVEIKDRRPDDWSPLLLEAWGEAADDPAAWAKAAQDTGCDLIQLSFSLTDATGETTTAESAVSTVKACLLYTSPSPRDLN